MEANYTSGSMVPENTMVSFQCSVQASPDPKLSLWWFDGTEHKASYLTATGEELVVELELTKEHHEADFYCTAVLHDPEYQFTSNTISFDITGKLTNYYGWSIYLSTF